MKAAPKKVAAPPQPAQLVRRNHGWVEKPPHAPVPVCKCGNKYIKTRKDQRHCLRCIHDPNIPVIL